jgi:hypothetical protein
MKNNLIFIDIIKSVFKQNLIECNNINNLFLIFELILENKTNNFFDTQDICIKNLIELNEENRKIKNKKYVIINDLYNKIENITTEELTQPFDVKDETITPITYNRIDYELISLIIEYDNNKYFVLEKNEGQSNWSIKDDKYKNLILIEDDVIKILNKENFDITNKDLAKTDSSYNDKEITINCKNWKNKILLYQKGNEITSASTSPDDSDDGSTTSSDDNGFGL